MYAAIRLKGDIKVRKDIKDTFTALGLKRKNTLVIVPDTRESMGMLRKVENFVAWGTASEELVKKVPKKSINLKSPKGGFISMKHKHPKGDVGYMGDRINKLAEKMMK